MNEAFDINVLKRLFRELWLQSNNCTQPISSIWFSVNEVARCSQKTSLEIKNYLNFLIENKVIQNISKEPLLHEFTAFGKKIKTELDIEQLLIKNL
jgi:flagellar biosynthesis regulator FlbT